MDQRLHFLPLATTDLDVTRRPYRDGLGWTVFYDEPGEIVFFQIDPGLLVSFLDAVKFDQDLLCDQPSSGANGITLAHNVPDRDSVVATLAAFEAAGGTILKPAQECTFGGVFHSHAADPTGVIETRESMSQGPERSYSLYQQLGLDSVGYAPLDANHLTDTLVLA